MADLTGCGNAFCGGFLAEWSRSKDLKEAGVWGCVAGSIMAEWEGVPSLMPRELHWEGVQRVSALRPQARQLRRLPQRITMGLERYAGAGGHITKTRGRQANPSPLRAS